MRPLLPFHRPSCSLDSADDEYPSCSDCQDGCGGSSSEECQNDDHTTTIDGIEYGICDCDGMCDHFDGYLGDWTQPCKRDSSQDSCKVRAYEFVGCNCDPDSTCADMSDGSSELSLIHI